MACVLAACDSRDLCFRSMSREEGHMLGERSSQALVLLFQHGCLLLLRLHQGGEKGLNVLHRGRGDIDGGSNGGSSIGGGGSKGNGGWRSHCRRCRWWFCARGRVVGNEGAVFLEGK